MTNLSRPGMLSNAQVTIQTSLRQFSGTLVARHEFARKATKLTRTPQLRPLIQDQVEGLWTSAGVRSNKRVKVGAYKCQDHSVQTFAGDLVIRIGVDLNFL